MRKVILALVAALSVSACADQEQLVVNAENLCHRIGYRIETERVPTLDCVKEGYYHGSASQSGSVGAVVSSAVIVASSGIVK